MVWWGELNGYWPRDGKVLKKMCIQKEIKSVCQFSIRKTTFNNSATRNHHGNTRVNYLI